MVRLNAEVGSPVMRPLFLQFENDSLAYSQDYEYMYGSDLLVAPVLLPGVDTWTVYLPGPESWVHLWTGERLQGDITKRCSHWSSSYITVLSLVETFIMMKYFQGFAMPALL